MLNKKRIIFIFCLLLLGDISIVRSQEAKIDKALLSEIAEKIAEVESVAKPQFIENFYKDNPAIEKKIKSLLENIKNKVDVNKYQIIEEFGAPKAILQKGINSEEFWYIYRMEYIPGQDARKYNIFDTFILRVSINKDSSLVEDCSIYAQPIIVNSESPGKKIDRKLHELLIGR